jgi:hypothetical protein
MMRDVWRLVLVAGALHCGPKPASGPPLAETPPEPPRAAAKASDAPAKSPGAAGSPDGAKLLFAEPALASEQVTIPDGYDNFYRGPELFQKLKTDAPSVAVWLHEPRTWTLPEMPVIHAAAVREFTQSGFKVVHDRAGRRFRVTTLENPTGQRVMVRMDADPYLAFLSTYALLRPAQPLALPGPCVPIPTVSFEVHEKRGGDEYTQRTTTEYRFDLDNDGVFDGIVPLAEGVRCHDDVKFALYVTRGACGHHVGTVRGLVYAELSAPAPGKLRNITVGHHSRVSGADGKPLDRSGESHFSFDGTTYKEVDQKLTEEPCRACPVECLGPQPMTWEW